MGKRWGRRHDTNQAYPKGSVPIGGGGYDMVVPPTTSDVRTKFSLSAPQKRQLLSEIDTTYSIDSRKFNYELAKEMRDDSVYYTILLIKDPKKLVTDIWWNGEYGAGISNDSKIYLFKLNRIDPVPIGDFMNLWEPDHQKYFGVNESMWDGMEWRERAIIESKLQTRLWARSEYKEKWLKFYRPVVYDNIWREEGKNLPVGMRYRSSPGLYMDIIRRHYEQEAQK